MDCDIAIIGAGPAGLTAARFASQKGANVLIFDRKREIGTPVRCAEAVAGGIADDFEIGNREKWLLNTVHHFKIISSKVRVAKVPTSPYLLHVVDRAAFEKELARMAIREGAELSLGKSVTGVDNNVVHIANEKIETKLIIGADGVESRIGKWIGMNKGIPLKDIGACAQQTLVEIDIDPDSLEFYLGNRYSSSGGYAWMFPRSKDEANVGIGVPGSGKDMARKALEHFISSKYPSSHSIRTVAGCVPRSPPLDALVRGNVLLVGDAARLVNPFSGGGIANAFISGKIAGEIAGDVAVKDKPLETLKQYELKLKERVGKNLKKSYRYKNLFLMKDRNIEFLCILLKFSPSFLVRRFTKGLHY